MGAVEVRKLIFKLYGLKPTSRLGCTTVVAIVVGAEAAQEASWASTSEVNRALFHTFINGIDEGSFAFGAHV